jgi:hypothetical protein
MKFIDMTVTLHQPPPAVAAADADAAADAAPHCSRLPSTT